MAKKLTVDKGFNKIENCFKNFNVLPNHWNAKVAKNRISFMKLACFLSYLFYDQLLACPLIYY